MKRELGLEEKRMKLEDEREKRRDSMFMDLFSRMIPPAPAPSTSWAQPYANSVPAGFPLMAPPLGPPPQTYANSAPVGPNQSSESSTETKNYYEMYTM